MTDERFDYARKTMRDAIENSASHIVWVIARETGKNLGSDAASIRERERLQEALETFLNA